MLSQGVFSKLKRSVWQSNGPSYERLESGFNKEDPTSKRSSRHIKPVAITAFVLTIFLFLVSGNKSTDTKASLTKPLPPAYLRLVLPASKPDVNICKTLISAAALNYPEPVLAGWQGKRAQTVGDDASQPLSRKSNIASVNKYLQNLNKTRDDDLVLIADGFNTWFQLRPQTLLDRYFEANRQADERIRKTIGTAADTFKLRQTILFASQRDCSPWSPSDPACYAAPESSLPTNVYGSQTDVNVGDERDPYAKHRPRYLHSGFAIGPLKDMRALYSEAAKRALADGNLQDDERVLAQIFGEQEIARVVYKQQSLSTMQRFFAWMSSFWQSTSYIAAQQAQQLRETDLSSEFGIGLDYASSLAFESIHAQNDAEWLNHSNTTQIHDANKAREIIDSKINEIESDIASSLPPFWTFSSEPLPRNLVWENVSLLTNVWTGVAPAIVQHDSRSGGTAYLREAWWSHLWYQKYARKLYDVHIQSPIGAIAVAGYNSQTRRSWWGPEDWKGGARNTTGFWWRYEDMCTGFEKEIFRDSKGPWYLPANH